MEEKHSSMPIEGVVLEADDSAAKKKKSTKNDAFGGVLLHELYLFNLR